MINTKNFLANTLEWKKLRHDQFQYNWPLKGGWEGWIQVELMAYFLRMNGTQNILREQPIYINPQNRVDLLVNADEAFNMRIPVEIKAQSFNNASEFVPGVQNDLTKVSENRQPSYTQCECIVMGMCFDNSAIKALLDIRHDGHKIFKHLDSPRRGDNEIAILYSVLGSKGKWKKAD